MKASVNKISSGLGWKHFFLATLAVSGGLAFLSHSLDMSALSLAIVISPMLLAVVFSWIQEGAKGIKTLLLQPFRQGMPLKWWLLSILFWPALIVFALAIAYWPGSSETIFRPGQVLPQLIIIAIVAIGEEFGWRGYALPRLLAEFGPLRSTVILGVIWGLWHVPGYLIGIGVPDGINLLVFLFWVLLASFVFTFFYLKTRNVLSAIVLHFMANLVFNYTNLLPEVSGSMVAFYILLFSLSLLVIFLFRKPNNI